MIKKITVTVLLFAGLGLSSAFAGPDTDRENYAIANSVGCKLEKQTNSGSTSEVLKSEVRNGIVHYVLRTSEGVLAEVSYFNFFGPQFLRMNLNFDARNVSAQSGIVDARSLTNENDEGVRLSLAVGRLSSLTVYRLSCFTK